MTTDKKSVVLSSGGLDSTTVMAIAKNEGYALYSLSFLYGQRHKIELEAAKKVAEIIGVEKHLSIDVPKNKNEEAISVDIPVTYVPARNTIFLSYALAWAEVIGSSDIFIGVNAIDYSGYPDCRPEYIEAFEKMANLATKAGVEGLTRIKINTPLLNMSKAQIIKKGIELGVDYSLTHSCYDPNSDGFACGRCDSCILRKKGFKEAGVKDPAKHF
jgi:7-cyano-7-deazaguanine synthase